MENMIPYELLEELGYAITAGEMVYNGFSLLLSIATYVLRSIGLYTIAKRRGIANPWLAWIPVAWVWVLGSISDQFRYVTKAQIKSKRKVLVAMHILSSLVTLVVVVLLVINLVGAIDVINYGTEEEMITFGLTLLFQFLGLGAVALIVAILYLVFYYIALFDLYTSVNPSCNVLFLVLGILFPVTTPFFIFFNRKQDGGMPPRCDVPQEPLAGYTVVESVPVIPAPVVEETVEEPVEESAEEPAEEE